MRQMAGGFPSRWETSMPCHSKKTESVASNRVPLTNPRVINNSIPNEEDAVVPIISHTTVHIRVVHPTILEVDFFMSNLRISGYKIRRIVF